jgi:hypothetical protein
MNFMVVTLQIFEFREESKIAAVDCIGQARNSTQIVPVKGEGVGGRHFRVIFGVCNRALNLLWVAQIRGEA